MNRIAISTSASVVTRFSAALGLLVATPCMALAQSLSLDLEPAADVPDGNASGLVSVIQVPPGSAAIVDIDVTVTLTGVDPGGWNGDLYLLLSHQGVTAVLANRPGISGSNPFGYGDNGLLNVTFDDAAAAGDFHVYQDFLGRGDSDMPITGRWQPDGRATDPALVLDTDPRTWTLDRFNHLVAEGEWRLFVADLSFGAAFSLTRWELHVATAVSAPVPESNTLAAAAVISVLGGVQWWLHRRRGAI